MNSQQGLAERLDVSVSTIRGWELGTRTPHTRQRRPLAGAFGVDPVVIRHVIERLPINPTNWRKSSFSMGNNNCVELADTGDMILLRDSKHPGGGHLEFPCSELLD